MAIQFNGASNYVKRLTGVVQPSSDYSCVFWARFNGGLSNGNYRTIFSLIDDPIVYTYFVGMFTDAGSYNTTLQAGNGSFSGTSGTALADGTWYPIAYTRAGNTHSFYVAGTLIGTVSVNISAGTFGWLSLGADTYDNGGAPTPDGRILEFTSFKEWNANIGLTRIQLESNSPSAVVDSTNLVTFTPLSSNLLDTSGNGNNWTAVGSNSFVSDPLFPTNSTSITAKVVSSLDYTDSVDLNPLGTFTFDAWYKFTSDYDGVLGVWGFGNLVGYHPGYEVYYQNDATQYLNYIALPDNDSTFPNRPFLMPVETGITYYFQFFPNSGNPAATLSVSMEKFIETAPSIGDFISNREADDDYEHPLTVSSGSTSYLTKKYVQLGTIDPAGRGTTVGLPHGDNGAIVSNGNFMLADDQFGTIKIYDKSFALVATITTYNDQSPIVGSNQTNSKFYVAYQPISTFHLDELDSAGNVTNTWTLTGLTSIQRFNVNDDASFMYFSQNATNSLVKKINLVTNAQTTLATVNNNSVEDVLYLQDDTILVVFYTNSGAPTTVQVKHYDPTGSVLNTYTFGGALWRNSFNPPRIGFALDSPTSFWITLKPQSNFEQSIFRNILVSDGSQIGTDIIQINYLFGQYIGSQTDSPASRFGPEKSFALLVMPAVSVGTLVIGKASNPLASGSFTVTGPNGDFTIETEGTESVEVNSGTYSVIEEADDSYATSYYVSNDPTNNDNENVVVGDGEVVDVVIVNELSRAYGGLYQMNPIGGGSAPVKKNDTLRNQDDSTVDKIINWFWELFTNRDK